MMLSMITRLQSIVRRDEGQDLLEYALLVALIALVAVGAITLAGKTVTTIFGQIATALTPSELLLTRMRSLARNDGQVLPDDSMVGSGRQSIPLCLPSRKVET